MALDMTLESLPSLARDTDAVAELRESILRLANRNPDCCSRDCTIRLLACLTYASRQNLVSGLGRDVCQDILAESCSCRILPPW